MREIKVNHQLDALFDVPPGETVITVPVDEQALQVVDIVSEEYDEKDTSIDTELESVRKMAIDAYETQMVAATTAQDGKYTAENADVAARFLSIALDAVKEKSAAKSRKDKLSVDKAKITKPVGSSSPSQVTNNTIVADRNTILEMLRKGTTE